ncbi:MAG: hypothetical protein QM718_13015 [Steroidobacteraceae bacterium]
MKIDRLTVQFRPLMTTLCTAALLSGLSGLSACSSLGERRGADSAAMGGTWQLDTPTSDDAAALIRQRMAKLMKSRRRNQQRLGPGEVPPLEDPDDQPGSGDGADAPADGAGSGDAGPAGPGGDAPGGGGPGGPGGGATMNQRLERIALEQFLLPPQRLNWQFSGESVHLKVNDEPVRILEAGQSAARFDSSGAATVRTGWDHNSFVIDSNYVNGERREERYTLDPNGSLLRVQRTISGTMTGKLSARSVYRRAD